MPNKKKFRVIGVSSVRKCGDAVVPRNIKVFARELEMSMNALKEDGYIVALVEQDNGTLVTGRIEDDEYDEDARVDPRRPLRHLCTRSQQLFGVFMGAARSTKVEHFEPAAREQAPTIFSAFTVEELRVASIELRKEADAHEVEHTNPECELSDVMRIVATLIDSHVATNLQ
jgi:hypothetical protein